jgi:hypothetical protein
MKLAELRKAQILQAHHWKAAEWFKQHQNHSAVVDACHLIARNNISTRINPYELLVRVCVKGMNIGNGDAVVGILREALNACHRISHIEAP